MKMPERKPTILIQNRLPRLLVSAQDRVSFYTEVLESRLAEVESGAFRFKIPGPRGLRLRLPGKPFHATPEFFFQLAGKTQFLLPDQVLSIGVGEATLIPAGMPHGEKWSGSHFLNMIVMFQPEGFSLHLGYIDGAYRCTPVDKFHFNGHLAILRYAEEAAADAGGEYGDALQRGLCMAVLACLRRGIEHPSPPCAGGHPLLQACMELIDSQFSRFDFSVIWLAGELGCSADHLSRLFRRHTGRRLTQFVHEKRIHYARYLLRDSDMNIAETAWACGFGQPSYFDRIFRTHTGLTPRGFREALLPAAAGPVSRLSPPARELSPGGGGRPFDPSSPA